MREWLCADLFFEATINLALMGVLCILVNQYIIGNILSIYVTFKYVLDLELEIPTLLRITFRDVIFSADKGNII